MTTEQTRPALEDLNVIVAGQGGDGSLTVITLLAGLLRERGLNVYTERDVHSRIKGGHAAATLRAFIGQRYCIGSHIDLLVAFDQEAIHKKARHLDSESSVIYDNSGGDLPAGLLPEGVRVYAAPFSRAAMRNLRRELFKNSVAFAMTGRLLGLEDEAMRQSFQQRFKRLGARILEYNLEALDMGFALADEQGLGEGASLYQISRDTPRQKILITGNEATAFGFLAAGGRFFAGYPITPSTDIMEWLAKRLPKFGGVVKQTEDELSAINMAIGAALTGTRTMTATCGPGLALMQEGISQIGMAEIPMVVVDAQRGGPSTGLPTKPEQSDLNMMIFGAPGDFPRIVLSPGHPEDCFYLTVEACNLAQQYQCLVYLALDQGLSQNLATIEPFDLERVKVDQGRRLDQADLEQLDVYRRYELSEDGVSPYTVPGTPGGLWLVTGNEHDEFGLVSTDPDNRVRQMDKRMAKIEAARPNLPVARHYGPRDAEIGFIGTGLTFGVILEAMERLEAQGLRAQYLQPRTLWPMLDETLEFVERCDRVYVVEHNASAQLMHLLIRQGASGRTLRDVLKYDGTPFRPGELVQRVLQKEKKAVHS